jgi:hypothetical protein
MTYVASAIALIWFSVTLFLCGRSMNLQRLTLNNLAPEVNPGGPEYNALRKIMNFHTKPELFNAEGQKYLKRLRRNALLFGSWMCVGMALSIWLSPYFMTP